MNYFMGIDTGTQGVRIGVYDESGKCIVSGDQSWDTNYPELGWAEQNPNNWWSAIIAVLEKISSKLTPDVRHNILTCCVDATSTTMFAVDENGEPLHDAIMWMDIRASKEAKLINSTNSEVLKYCGGEVSAEWFVPKLLWCKNNMPNVYKKANLYVEQLDWVNYKLSGVWTTSICNMTCKGNYVDSRGGYDLDFLKSVGLEEWEDKAIQRIDKIGAPIGKILPEIASLFDLNPDMLLVQGGIDAHIGMFGTNAISDGRLSVIMGTSFVHLGLVDKKIDMQGIWGPYENAVLDGTWCVEGGQASAAALINWFVDNFNIKHDNPFAYLAVQAHDVPAGCEGLVIVDNFQGNRTPYKDSDATGLMYGLRMKHTWKHIYRAILESICFGTRNIVDNFDKQGYKVNEIVACGGVTKNLPFLQICADVTGKTIIVNEDAQGGVLGCAVIGAAVSIHNKDFVKAADLMVHKAKEIKPNLDNKEAYDKAFDNYIDLYQSTKHISKK